MFSKDDSKIIYFNDNKFEILDIINFSNLDSILMKFEDSTDFITSFDVDNSGRFMVVGDSRGIVTIYDIIELTKVK